MKEITLNNDEETIIRVVEKASGLSYSEIKSRKRQEHIAIARNILGVLLRQEHYIQFNRIGQIVNRNHASIVYYCKTWQDNYDGWPEYKRLFDKCMNIMESQNVITNMQIEIAKRQIDEVESILEKLKYKLLNINQKQ